MSSTIPATSGGITFYHLTATPVERALPRLVEKAYAAGHRVLVVNHLPERLDALDQALWTFSSPAFIPHGKLGDGQEEDQPVLLAPAVDNRNGADILFITDGAALSGTEGFSRLLDLFDGNDAEAVAKARTRWKTYQNAGHPLTYMRQTEQGGWEEKKVA